MKVIFCTPSYDRTVTVEYLLSMERTRELLASEGIEIAPTQIVGGDCYVHHARNTLVADFLDSDATDMFFVDQDEGWPADAVLRMLRRPYEFVAGIYPFKRDMEGYPCGFDVDGNGEIVTDPETGCIALAMAATGFWRLRRSVFEKMRPMTEPYTEHGRTFRTYFRTPVIDGVWHGEDPAFCRYWIMLGGKIWAEPDIDFEHCGRKSWRGNFAKFVEQLQEARALARAVGSASPEQRAVLERVAPDAVAACLNFIANAPGAMCRSAA
jgi:hypothetical protein